MTDSEGDAHSDTQAIRHPVDVRAFLWQRCEELSITPPQLASEIGIKSKGYVNLIFTGRVPFSSSKYFSAICELLKITTQQQEAITNAESRNRKKRLRPPELPEDT